MAILGLGRTAGCSGGPLLSQASKRESVSKRGGGGVGVRRRLAPPMATAQVVCDISGDPGWSHLLRNHWQSRSRQPWFNPRLPAGPMTSDSQGSENRPRCFIGNIQGPEPLLSASIGIHRTKHRTCGTGPWLLFARYGDHPFSLPGHQRSGRGSFAACCRLGRVRHDFPMPHGRWPASPCHSVRLPGREWGW